MIDLSRFLPDHPGRSRRLAGLVLFLLLLCGPLPPAVHAAPPENFAVEDVLLNLEQPMSMRFLPDGRLLVIQKKGTIRILDTSTTPATAAVYLNLAAAAHADGIKSDQERGLLDIALDPDFPNQPYLYLLYTPNTGPNGQRTRVARFTHQENGGGLNSRGDPGSEVILWEDTDGYDSCCHYGGSLDFGPDGRLWITVGDHFQGSYAASLEHAGGAVLRINRDGSIPADNPWVDGAGPNHDALFAKGLRNPFRARWDLPTGRLLIAEVGGNEQPKAWEDLHVIEYDGATGRFIDADFGTASDNGVFDGLNFGWPTVEGLPPHDDFPGAEIEPVAEPIFAYRHAGVTAAINGGVVYRGGLFPAEYQNVYFYADSTRDFIRYLKFDATGALVPNPAPDPISELNPDETSYPFDLTPIGRIVSLEVGPDGALYYLSFTDQGGAYGVPNPTDAGGLRRYVYDAGNARPVIASFTAEPAAGDAPLPVEFELTATDPELDAMVYTIDFGDGTTSGDPQPLLDNTPTVVPHTYAADGVYSARVDISDGTSITSQTLTVEVGTPPVITSLTATNHRAGGSNTSFRYGDTFTFAATATDAEDGTLNGAAFTWTVSFVRPGNVHPALGPESGVTSVEFPIPAQGQGFSGPVFYRAVVTVTDSSGLSATQSFDIFPEKSNITFNTEPQGIVVQIDGNTAQAAPFVLDTLINLDHTISVPSVVCVNGTEYVFDHWSNGPTTAQQEFIVPETDTTLTATFVPVGPCAEPPDEGLVMHLTADAGVILNGDSVAAWEDQSPSGNHLGAIGTPGYVEGGINAQHYVHFDGGIDALTRTGFVGLPTGAAPRSVFMFVRYNAADSSTNGWAGLAYGARASNQVFGLALTPAGTLGVQGWGGANDVPANPAVDVTGQWVTHAAVYDGAVLTQYQNGTAAGTAARTYATGTQAIWLGEEFGGGKNLDMDVAEVLVYNRVLTPAELDLIQEYFETKYAVGPGGGTPPAVTITAPAANASFTVDELPVTLSGTAVDQDDGDLGEELRWHSDVDGPLGIGATLAVNLSPGTHRITATAVDRDGLETSDEVTVTITGGTSITPPPVTAGLVLHLESDLNVATGTGNTVAGWLDQSGLGNDLVAGGAPLLIGSGAPSGLPAIRFDGVDDRLERVHAIDPLGGLPTGNGNRTMFVVANYLSTTWWGGVAYGTAASNQAFGLGVKHPSGELVLQGFGGGNDLVSTTPGVGAGWLVQTGLLDGGVATLFRDGAPIAQFNHAYNTTLTRLVVGEEIKGNGFIGMDVAAVLIYDRALSSSERTQVEAYLADKYVNSAAADEPPVVTITAPADGASFAAGGSISFTATATDAEDGNLSAAITWTSSLDGSLGTGASVSTSTLQTGTHTITAAVTDSAEQTDTAEITIEVGSAANTAPTVAISAPADGSSHPAGSSLTFTATATDPEDGDLSANLVWDSDLDGEIGQGGTFSTASLSAGTHVITASVLDSADAVGVDSIAVTITGGAPGDDVPVTAGLVLHLDATQGVTESAGAVTAWADRSPLGNGVTGFGGVTLLPAATPAGTAALGLDGTDDYLERSHASAPLTGFPVGNGERTFFVVARYLSTTWWGGVAYGTGATNQAFGLGVKHQTGELVLQGFGKGNDLISATAGLGAGWLMQTGLVDDGVATLFKDGTPVAQFTHAYDTTLSRLVIGQEINQLGFIGLEIAAVLLYDRALTPAERTEVEAYLAAKYLAVAPGNDAPVVTITAPADGASFAAGASVTLTATATDSEDGDLAAGIAWASDRDGALGTGASVETASLSAGTHVITAAVSDSAGQSATASITITIETTSNQSPTVTITAPADGATFDEGATVNFAATATDPEDGEVSATIAWSSDLDGSLGSGAMLSTSALSAGPHLITATAVDTADAEGSASISLTITAAGPPPSGELPVTDGLVVHLDATSGVLTSGSTVTGWTDRSVRQNHLNGHNGVTLVPEATPAGTPALRLDGANDRLERTHASDPLQGLPTGNADRTLYAVVRYTSTTWWGGIAYGTGAANQAFGIGVKHPSGELVLQGFGKGNDLVSSTPGLGAGWMIQGALLQNGQASLTKDGVTVAQFAHTYDTTLTRFVIGQEINQLGFIGLDLAAVLVYDRALSAAERADVEAYLQSKYLGVGSGDEPPTVSITAPADGSTFEAGAPVEFTGTASDPEDGDLSGAITWTSDQDGALGSGASLTTTTLSVGAHVVTAAVTDAADAAASTSITITIEPANTAPTVTITAPSDGSNVPEGSAVTFTAEATDAEEGDLSATVAWTSDQDGALGTGASLTTDGLTAGTHVITASVTDAGGLEDAASITVTITPVLAVTSGLVLHLEATDRVAVTGDTVTGWSDLSPAGNDVLAFGGPRLIPDATPSGGPAIRLDGVNDRMERSHDSDPLNGFPTGNADRTFLLLARYESTTWWGGVAYGTAYRNRAFGLGVKHPSGELYLQGYGGANDLVSAEVGLAAGWLLQSGRLAGGVATLARDGETIAEWTHTYQTSLSRLIIGQDVNRTGFIGMEVAAVLLYDRALAPEEHARVVSYLLHKYVTGPDPTPAPLGNATAAQSRPGEARHRAGSGREIGEHPRREIGPGWFRSVRASAGLDYSAISVAIPRVAGARSPGSTTHFLRNRSARAGLG